MNSGKKGLPVFAISLGCPKNRADTENLLGSLGGAVHLVRSPGHAKLIFVNTCAFIEPAVRESIREIIKLIRRIKSYKRIPFLVVAGCLPSRYEILELEKELPEVDLWLDASSQNEWPARIQQLLNLPDLSLAGRLVLSPPPYAWIKISDGCNHSCNFCTIPSFKGKFFSRSASSIIQEAQLLLDGGIKELILVGQDISIWKNSDPRTENRNNIHNLTDLVRELVKLPALKWLRLLYLYPTSLDTDFLKIFSEIGSPLLPYLDVPFQHSESSILSAMGRPFQINPRELVEKFRALVPGVALRTTFIVGYPGETDKDFARLCEFVKEAKFTNLGVFIYQPEEGTRAAELPNQVPDSVKMERKETLMSLQANISMNFLKDFMGSTMEVLVDESAEEEWPGLFRGRVWFQAPEIDGITYISGPGVKAGEFSKGEINSTHTYDLGAIAPSE